MVARAWHTGRQAGTSCCQGQKASLRLPNDFIRQTSGLKYSCLCLSLSLCLYLTPSASRSAFYSCTCHTCGSEFLESCEIFCGSRKRRLLHFINHLMQAGAGRAAGEGGKGGQFVRQWRAAQVCDMYLCICWMHLLNASPQITFFSQSCQQSRNRCRFIHYIYCIYIYKTLDVDDVMSLIEMQQEISIGVKVDDALPIGALRY